MGKIVFLCTTDKRLSYFNEINLHYISVWNNFLKTLKSKINIGFSKLNNWGGERLIFRQGDPLELTTHFVFLKYMPFLLLVYYIIVIFYI